MNITANIHDAAFCECGIDLSDGRHVLQFKSAENEYSGISFFLPSSVARATADAFNEAMAQHEAGELAACRAREMNAELPDDTREVLQAKGMI